MHVTFWFLRLQGTLLRWVSKASWLSIAGAVIVLYVAGALLMPLFEGAGSDLATIGNYSWWFIVTTTTVGYGDMAPVTAGGRVTATGIMVFGIGTLAVSVAKIAEGILTLGRRRMKGLAAVQENDHLVIFGYHQTETEELIHQIRYGFNPTQLSIVLCSYRIEENPLPDVVKFVQGELTSRDVLERASVAQASRIFVHGHDDNETLVITLAARSVNAGAHIVAYLEKPETVVHIHRIDRNIECVTPLGISLAAQAIQDRGATEIVSALVSNMVDDTIYRLDVPDSQSRWTFGALQHHFKRRFGATLIAVGQNGARLNVNPAYSSDVFGGATLFYIAIKRLAEKEIDWSAIPTA